MKIVSVTAIPFRIPYRSAFRMATASMPAADHVLVKVTTDEGLVGVAEAPARPMIYGESQQSIVTAIRDWFAPAITGLDPFEIERVWSRLSEVVHNHTAKGALDIALHDLQGKMLGMPCWRLLGMASTSLPVVSMLSLGEPQAVAEEAAALQQELGINAFKLKVDPDVAAGVAILEAVRSAVGPQARIYVDANRSMRADEVLRLATRTRDLDLSLIEDPTPVDDVAGRRWLAARLDVPIVADETATTLTAAARELAGGTAQAVSIKTARTGFRESAKIVGLAQGMNALTVIGSQGDSAVGVAAALAFGAAHASTAAQGAELDFFRHLADQIVTEPPVIRAGRMAVDPTVPGIGVTVDEDKLRQYRVDV